MLNRLYGWYGKSVVRGVIGAGVVLLIVAVVLKTRGDSSVAPVAVDQKPEVVVGMVGTLQNAGSFSVVGTVRAVSEAQLNTEVGGRVTNVAVELGDYVQAGTVLATIENSRERAALLQAEGAYEAAQVGSLQNNTGLLEAKDGVVNAYRDTFSTVDRVVHTIIDQFYSNPGTSQSGFKLSGTGDSLVFITRRNEIEAPLATWSSDVTSAADTLAPEILYTRAEETLTRVNNLVVSLAAALTEDAVQDNLTDAEQSAYQGDIATARTLLDAAIGTITRVRSVYAQASLTAPESGATTQSSAQIKSALGVLRAAQANFERTLVRTPISGYVNTLNVTSGSSVTPGQPAAIVANNGALEIKTALGRDDVARIALGDTVRIDGVSTGTVTHIAPAIDPATGKSEVRMNSEALATLKNGSTVSITFTEKVMSEDSLRTVRIPLASLKMLASGPVVFTIGGESELVSKEVELGAVEGEMVVVQKGLTTDSEIVVDARGRKAGEVVTVIRK